MEQCRKGSNIDKHPGYISEVNQSNQATYSPSRGNQLSDNHYSAMHILVHDHRCIETTSTDGPSISAHQPCRITVNLLLISYTRLSWGAPRARRLAVAPRSAVLPTHRVHVTLGWDSSFSRIGWLTGRGSSSQVLPIRGSVDLLAVREVGNWGWDTPPLVRRSLN